MNEFQFEKLIREAAHKEKTKIPEDFNIMLKDTLNKLPEKEARKDGASGRMAGRRILTAAAVAAMLFVLLPNVSPSIAYAMEKLPVIGSVVKVITVRNYTHSDEHNDLNAAQPEIQEATAGEQQLNADVKAYVDELVQRFNDNAMDEGYYGLDVSYEVLTDNDRWFALRVNGCQVMASGYEFSRCYNIDKTTGKYVKLADLFKEGSDYVAAIKKDIFAQMKARMAADSDLTYWMEDDEALSVDYDELITREGAFYVDPEGRLVICFDEYDVAPGAMGAQSFTVSREAIAGLLR